MRGAALHPVVQRLRGHEREHRDSYNECVESGQQLQDAVSRLEAVAGQTVSMDTRGVIRDIFGILLSAGEAGLPPALTPDGMWYWRNLRKWQNLSHSTEGHGGQRGCP